MTPHTLDMLDAVTFQDGADVKPTNRQPLIAISIAWNRPQVAQQPDYEACPSLTESFKTIKRRKVVRPV